MCALQPLCVLLGIQPDTLSFAELQIAEATLFLLVCHELKAVFKRQHSDYFRLLRLAGNERSDMLEDKFARLIIQDILITGAYNLIGIANYTDTHTDVIDEVLLGRNTTPSGVFLRRIIELHREVRPELYNAIMKKMIASVQQSEK